MTNIEVTARHLGDKNFGGIKEYAEGQAKRFAEKFPRTISLKVVVDKQNHFYSAEFVAQMKDLGLLSATAQAETGASAIDVAFNRTARQIRENRSKKKDACMRVAAKQ